MKSIKKNLFYNTSLNILKVIYPLITAPYISRVLEPEGVGLSNFAITYAGYFALFASLGIPYYGIRETAKYNDDKLGQHKLLSEIFSLSLVTTGFAVLFFMISILFIDQLYNNFQIFLISGILLYIIPISIDWFYSGREEFGYITLRSLVVKVISLIALFLFVREKDDLIIYVILYVLAAAANEVWNFIKLCKEGLRPSLTLHFKVHVKPLLILFASTIAISIYTLLDTLMLGFLKDYEEVGYFYNANHVAKALVPIATSLAAVAIPRMSYYKVNKDWHQINVLMNKSLSLVSFLCFPLTFAIVTMAPVFVPLFFGENFMGSIIPLQIVAFVIIFIGLNNLTGAQILLGLGYDILFLKSVLVGTITNVLLNIILIPTYGAIGAAISSVVAEMLILFVTGYYVLSFTPVRLNNTGDLAKSIVCSISLIPIFFLLARLVNGWILIIGFLILGFIFYFILQFLLGNTSVRIVVQLIRSRIGK